MNIQSNLDANSKARARSWRLLKLEEAIAHREAGKYPISSDILDKTIDELKEKAIYVTTPCDQDGIYNACVHFGWIKEND